MCVLKCSSVKFLIRVLYLYSCSCLTFLFILCIGSKCRTSDWHSTHPSGVNPTISFARRWRPCKTMQSVFASFIFCFSLDFVFSLGRHSCTALVCFENLGHCYSFRDLRVLFPALVEFNSTSLTVTTWMAAKFSWLQQSYWITLQIFTWGHF